MSNNGIKNKPIAGISATWKDSDCTTGIPFCNPMDTMNKFIKKHMAVVSTDGTLYEENEFITAGSPIIGMNLHDHSIISFSQTRKGGSGKNAVKYVLFKIFARFAQKTLYTGQISVADQLVVKLEQLGTPKLCIWSPSCKVGYFSEEMTPLEIIQARNIRSALLV